MNSSAMRRAFRNFSDIAQSSDIAVVYYAGHGIEVDGANFLLPTDAVLERDLDVEDEAISVERIVKVLEPAKQLRLVILDDLEIQTIETAHGMAAPIHHGHVDVHDIHRDFFDQRRWRRHLCTGQ